jgi:hypothetical protein
VKPMRFVRSDALLDAAEALEGPHPDVAALLRDLAKPEALPESRGLRKRILRRLWRVCYPFAARTAAARLIASAWASFTPTQAPPIPDSKEELFDRLHRAGARPLAWRQIADELDPAFD